jgi:hypothetical protein
MGHEMNRSRYDKDTYISITAYSQFMKFAFSSGWKPDDDKRYFPIGTMDHVHVSKEDVVAILVAIKDGLRKLEAGESFINEWDNEEDIMLKTECLEEFEKEDRRAFMEDMVKYLEEPVKDAYGLFVRH